MYILNQSKTEIAILENFDRIRIQEYEDAICLYLCREKGAPIVLGRFSDVGESKQILTDIWAALANEQPYYDVPEKRFYAEEPKVMDARTKRRGGS